MTDQAPICLITGGSSGIGLATARHFATHGFCVAFCGRQYDRVAAAETEVALAAGNPARVLASVTDIGSITACQNLVQAVHQKFGRVDVLVNNAGVAPLAPICELSDAAMRAVWETNQQAVFAMTRAVWPIMQAQSGGTIVNVSSLAAVDPFPGFSLYGASKAWVELFTKATADEGRDQGIRAIAVRLGAVETPLLRGLFPEFPADKAVSAVEVAEFLFLLATQPVMRFTSGSAVTFAC